MIKAQSSKQNEVLGVVAAAKFLNTIVKSMQSTACHARILLGACVDRHESTIKESSKRLFRSFAILSLYSLTQAELLYSNTRAIIDKSGIEVRNRNLSPQRRFRATVLPASGFRA